MHISSGMAHARRLARVTHFVESRGRLDGNAGARLVVLACSVSPEGCERWTLRLLAKKIVMFEIVISVSTFL